MLKVLHVEDSPIACAVVAKAIHSFAAESEIANFSSEGAATEWLRAGQWELAVIDLQLEQGQGFNMLGKCRAAHPRGMIVVFSDFTAPHVERACLSAGADAAFRKSDVGGLTVFLRSRLAARGGGGDDAQSASVPRPRRIPAAGPAPLPLQACVDRDNLVP